MEKEKKAASLGSDFDFAAFEKEAVKQLKSGKPLSGKEGVLTPLIKRILENALQGELEAHLEEEPAEGKNRRNGKTSKTMKSEHGTFELEAQRDRNATFEPEIVKKRQTTLAPALEGKILSLYGLGMSYSDISGHIEEMYGIEISSATISSVTDKIIPVIEEWRSRPLDAVYPMIWMDAMHYKVKEDGRIMPKAVYTILGVNQKGLKEALGIYVSEAEGANFWFAGLNRPLQPRGQGHPDSLHRQPEGLSGGHNDHLPGH